MDRSGEELQEQSGIVFVSPHDSCCKEELLTSFLI